MNNCKSIFRQITRRWGVEVRQYDPDLSLDTYLWTFFSALKINCVIDVGAHRGEYAGFLRKNGYKGEIISFEPVLESYQHLQSLSASDDNWHIHHMALGTEDGMLDLNVGKGTNYSSFLQPSEYGYSTSELINCQSVQSVPVKRLDAVIEGVTAHIANPRIYLKMDTQGWDVNVFRGATHCLDKILALQSEMSLIPLYQDMPNWIEVVDVFRAENYEISNISAGFRDESLMLSEIDCVMVQKGVLAQPIS